MIGQLQTNIGDGGAFPNPATQIPRELRFGIGSVKKVGVVVHLQPLSRAPGEKLRHLESIKFVYGLFHDQIVDAHQNIWLEMEFFFRQENAVHADGKVVFEQT